MHGRAAVDILEVRVGALLDQKRYGVPMTRPSSQV